MLRKQNESADIKIDGAKEPGLFSGNYGVITMVKTKVDTDKKEEDSTDKSESEVR